MGIYTTDPEIHLARLSQRSAYPSVQTQFDKRWPSPQIEYFIGVDLGQVRDHTAIAVLERYVAPNERSPSTYQWNTIVRRSIRHLERLPLGVDYPSVVEHIRQLVSRPQLLNRSTLIVDATGTGRPVVDLLRQARLPCRMIPVTITSGGRETTSNQDWRVPKCDLITGLLVLFQTGQLEICAELDEAETLLKELGDMRVKVSEQGHETYGAWHNGEHDDMVLAAALACWRGTTKDRTKLLP